MLNRVLFADLNIDLIWYDYLITLIWFKYLEYLWNNLEKKFVKQYIQTLGPIGYYQSASDLKATRALVHVMCIVCPSAWIAMILLEW